MTLYVPLFRSCTTKRTLLQIHAHLLANGLHKDALASTKLIESYAKFGCIATSKQIFDYFSMPDSFMLAVMIKCYVGSHVFQDAISFYHAMLHYKQLHITSFVFPPVLKACSGLHDVGIGRKVHARIVKLGFEFDAMVGTSLIEMYGACSRLEDACLVFDGMPMRDVVSWSWLLSSCIRCGRADIGLEVFSAMVLGKIELDSVVLLQAARVCADLGCLKQLKSVHGHIVRRWIPEQMQNSLILLYNKCGDLSSQEKLFKRESNKDVVSWTCTISCYNERFCYGEALRTFVDMRRSGIEPNSVTMMSIIHSCIHRGCFREGKSVHGFILRRATGQDMSLIASSLIKMYGSFNKLRLCQSVFDTVQEKTLLCWNSLIASYAQNGSSKQALRLLVQMRKEGLVPDSFTLSGILSSCGHVGDFNLAVQIHGHVLKSGLHLNEFVQNSLIDMYCKCGFAKVAYNIFEEHEQKDIITWNIMIGGFDQNGNSKEAIALYDQMQFKCLQMDGVTFLGAIQACSHLGSLTKGRRIHHTLIVSGVQKDMHLDAALINMYAKCGDLEMARSVFDHATEKNVVCWSSIISAYGTHGQVEDAMLMFTQMIASGALVNEVTFMNLLSACSHAGLVKQGLQYFELMREFHVEPQLEHCACIVDLLSRAGDIDKAYKLIESMPAAPDVSIWRALLNGCYINQRTDMISSSRKRNLEKPVLLQEMLL